LHNLYIYFYFNLYLKKMNIDISELNDLNDNINEDNEKNKNNEENNEIIDINDDRNNDINKKIYSWKTILRDFKEASSGNSQHVKGKNANSGNLLGFYWIYIYINNMILSQ